MNNKELINAFKIAYGEDIEKYKVVIEKYDEILSLNEEGYDVTFRIEQGEVRLFPKDKNGKFMSFDEIDEALSLKHQKNEIERQQAIDNKPKYANLKIFGNSKKSKKTKLKEINPFVKIVLSVALAATLVSGVEALIHKKSADTISDAVVSAQVQGYEQTGECPYTFTDNVGAYLQSPELFGTENGVMPIMRFGDTANSYGLSHDINGNYSFDGSAYVDYRTNNIVQEDAVSLVYGHNNAAIFGNLNNYIEDGNICPDITCYTEDGEYRLHYLGSITDQPYSVIEQITYTDDYDSAKKELSSLLNMDVSTSNGITIFQTCADNSKKPKLFAIYSSEKVKDYNIGKIR